MQILPQHRHRAQAKEVPLLRLQMASKLPNWLFGLLCGVFVFGCLLIAGLVSLPEAYYQDVAGVALFFATTFAILAAFTVPVFRGIVEDLRALRPILPLSDDDFECLALGLTRATRRELTVATLVGLFAGSLHISALNAQQNLNLFAIAQGTGTIALWVLMVTTLTKLVMNASVFSGLGRIAEPDLLRPSRHAAFGSAALRPTLFLIGLLCAYAFLYIGDGVSFESGVWVGASLCVVAMVGIFVLPLGGIRDRIQLQRVAIINSLDLRLESLANDDLGAVEPAVLRDMDTILDMRERVVQAPSWPLDLALVRRILLYVVLPPMTWAAAALVEMLIDGLL